MAKKDFLVNLDLNKNELFNFKFQNLATAPTLTTTDKGYTYYNTTDSKVYSWSGSVWIDLTSNGVTNLTHTKDSTTVTIVSSTGTNTSLAAADASNAGVMTSAQAVKLAGIATNADVTNSTSVNSAGAVMESDYTANSILVANSAQTPVNLIVTANSVVGRMGGNVQNISIDNDLTSVSAADDTIASAKATKAYTDSVVAAKKVYQLHKPDGTTPFVYTDAAGKLHIDGDIVQSGSTFITHTENVNSSKDIITLRDGAVVGLGAGIYSGIVAKLYDGVNDGQLVFDNTGTARVGDVGSLQPICTRPETPTDGYIGFWENANSRLNFKQLTISDISNLSSYAGSTNLTTTGTINTGVWNGTLVSSTYGGTGVNNAGRTLTISTNSGTLLFSGAGSTLTIGAGASVSGSNTGDQTTITGNAGTATKLAASKTIAIDGDITGAATAFDGSANISISATLPNLVTAGTYNQVTVNSKGLVTSATNTSGSGTLKYAVDITGNGVLTTFSIVHNLNTLDIVTFIKEASTSTKIEVEEVITNANTLTINFNTAPANNKVYRVVIIG